MYVWCYRLSKSQGISSAHYAATRSHNGTPQRLIIIVQIRRVSSVHQLIPCGYSFGRREKYRTTHKVVVFKKGNCGTAVLCLQYLCMCSVLPPYRRDSFIMVAIQFAPYILVWAYIPPACYENDDFRRTEVFSAEIRHFFHSAGSVHFTMKPAGPLVARMPH
jgi:hypothetical protein